MKFLKLLLLFYHLIFVNCGQSTQHNDTLFFTHDKTWPDFTTVQSLPVYGSAVAVDGKNNIIVLHRGATIANSQKHNYNSSVQFITEDVIMILSPSTGKCLATWGANKFIKPHGIEISGQSIFITDVVLHQVFKFSHDSRTGLWKHDPEIVLGEMLISGNDPTHFCSPTDVAVLSKTKEFFVSDGYCNSRVVKFDKYGAYQGEFGAGISNPMSAHIHFNVTHAVTIGEPSSYSSCVKNPKMSQPFPLIFVADRNNGRIQTFFENGTFLYEIPYESFGPAKEMLFSLAFLPGKMCSVDEPYGTLYAILGHLPFGQSKIFEILVGPHGYHLRSTFPFSGQHNIVNGSITSNTDRIENPHDIAVSKDGFSVYVIEAYGKLILKRFRSNRINFLSTTSGVFGSTAQRIYYVLLQVILLYLSASFVG